MFAKTIIDSDIFLDMPASAQCLYFHLAMRADDEGFLNNPKKIQRMVNASDDDMRLLLAKRFILAFDSGVIVIKHWRIHNYIQKDRFKPTVYTEEKAKLSVKPNGAYTDHVQDVYEVDTPCIQDGYGLDSQDRLGKERIGKDSIGQENAPAPAIASVMDYYMDNIQAVPSPFAVQDLKHFTEVLGADVVIHACAVAQDEGKRSWNYIRAILQRYEKEGLLTLASVTQDEQQRRDVQEARKPNKITTAAEYATRKEKPIGNAEMEELKKFAASFG